LKALHSSALHGIGNSERESVCLCVHRRQSVGYVTCEGQLTQLRRYDMSARLYVSLHFTRSTPRSPSKPSKPSTVWQLL